MKSIMAGLIEKKTIENLRVKLEDYGPKWSYNYKILDCGSGIRGSYDYDRSEFYYCLDKCYGDDLEEGINYPDYYFDTVVCSGVIQYINNWNKLRDEIARVLKPHGKLIIVTINPDSLLHRMKLIKKEPKGDEKNIFTTNEMEIILNNKFKIKEKFGVSFIPMPFGLCINQGYFCEKRG